MTKEIVLNVVGYFFSPMRIGLSNGAYEEKNNIIDVKNLTHILNLVK